MVIQKVCIHARTGFSAEGAEHKYTEPIHLMHHAHSIVKVQQQCSLATTEGAATQYINQMVHSMLEACSTYRDQ